MQIVDLLKENIKKAVEISCKFDVKNIEIEHPDNSDNGDYSTNVAMILARELKNAPIKIANQITQELDVNNMTFVHDDMTYPIFDDITAVAPGFINFYLSKEWLASKLTEIINSKETFGSSKEGNGKKVLVEFSQMNTNKPQHIGHARNNFLGSCVANILKFSGFDVLRSVYAGDIGAHETKSMLMYKLYGDNKDPDKKPDHFVGDFYVMFGEKVEEDPSLEDQAKQMLIDWEDKDPEVIALWEKLNNWVYEGWEETYKNQKIEYDIREYESDHVTIGKEMAEYAIEKGIAERDETGAIISHLEKYDLPDKVLLRSDGTSLYVTKDLQLAKDSYETHEFEKRIYVVDYRQTDYFKQVFKILEILGFDWFDKLHHLAYGMVTLPGGNMSSRKGVIVSADEVYEKIIDVERTEIAKSIKNVKSPEETVQAVALSAFRYGMLKVDANQNIVFDYDQVTKFEGNTGPYLMYSFARANSVLQKAGIDNFEVLIDIDSAKVLDLNEKELALLRTLYMFPEVVEKSAELLEPHHIATYVYNVAQSFNSFYSVSPILDAESEDLKNFRLELTMAAAQVIKNALKLMDIDVVEKM